VQQWVRQMALQLEDVSVSPLEHSTVRLMGLPTVWHSERHSVTCLATSWATPKVTRTGLHLVPLLVTQTVPQLEMRTVMRWAPKWEPQLD